MHRLAILAVLLLMSLLCGVLLSGGRATVAAPVCPAPPEVAAPDVAPGMFPRVAGALQAGHLTVLAIGSGTVLGARGRAEGSFSDQMAQDLRNAMPGTDIRLVLRGERGITAAGMLAIMSKELGPQQPGRQEPGGHHFDLVVWQTGTVEAVRNAPPDQFARTLDEGAAAVRLVGADLLLVDPQYSRMLQSHAALDPYREAMQDAAHRHGAVLFRRFELGRSWADAGQLDLESASRPERRRITERLNACLGAALAQTVLRAAGRLPR